MFHSKEYFITFLGLFTLFLLVTRAQEVQHQDVDLNTDSSSKVHEDLLDVIVGEVTKNTSNDELVRKTRQFGFPQAGIGGYGGNYAGSYGGAYGAYGGGYGENYAGSYGGNYAASYGGNYGGGYAAAGYGAGGYGVGLGVLGGGIQRTKVVTRTKVVNRGIGFGGGFFG